MVAVYPLLKNFHWPPSLNNTATVNHHYATWRWTEDDLRKVIHIGEIIKKGLNGPSVEIYPKDQGRNQGNTPYSLS